MFLRILGLRLEQTSEIKYDVLDNENKIVGSIEKVLLHKKNNRRNLPAVYGYKTIINNGQVKMDYTRKIHEDKASSFIFSYEFDKYVENKKNHIELVIDESPRMNILSEEHGNLEFKVNDNTLRFSYMKPHETLNCEETLVVRLGKIQSAYRYGISYCDKKYNLETDESKVETRTFSVQCDNYDNSLHIETTHWKNGMIVYVEPKNVVGTIAEVINKNDMALDAFKNFKKVANKILPCEDGIVELLLETAKVAKEFMPFFEKQEQIDMSNSHVLKKSR